MQANFTQATETVKAYLAQGDVKAAMTALDALVWPLADKDKALRTKAHDLGNAIQAAIFEQYLTSEGSN